MPELIITCPNKGKEIATGIDIFPSKPHKAARLFIRCPHCGILHGCSPSDGILNDASVRTSETGDPAQNGAALNQWVVEA